MINDVKIAIYIDTNSLFNGKVVGMSNIIDEMANFLNKNDAHIKLITNDIVKLEIRENVDRIKLPKLSIYLTNKQIENAQNDFMQNKADYIDSIDKLFDFAENIQYNPTNEDVIEGCQRQYANISPWGVNGKSNEWKDYFAQIGLIKWYQANKEGYNQLHILSKDNDFEYLNNADANIYVWRHATLHEFIAYIQSRINPLKDIKNNIKERIIMEIKNTLYDELVHKVEQVFIWETGRVLDFDDYLTIEIDDIIINDCSDLSNISCTADFSVSGIDRENDIYDKEDGKYFGGEDEFIDTIECSFSVDCECINNPDDEYILKVKLKDNLKWES